MTSTEDSWSATAYNTNASFVYSTEYSTPVLKLLAPQLGERIIDFGCGTGELSIQISNLVGKDGVVVGVDSSQSMVCDCALSVMTGTVLFVVLATERIRCSRSSIGIDLPSVGEWIEARFCGRCTEPRVSFRF